jgi:hypothetical protein
MLQMPCDHDIAGKSVQLLICDWTGKTKLFESSALSSEELQEEISEMWEVPFDELMLSSPSNQLQNMLLGLNEFAPKCFSTIHLQIRCLGGKGGFGAMLRGQQSRPGMKKVTPNTGSLLQAFHCEIFATKFSLTFLLVLKH